MNRKKYRIYELSARAIIANSKPNSEGRTIFDLNSAQTEKCRVISASHEQEDNALFHQIMCEKNGNGFSTGEENTITELEDIIFYCNFENIFDRDSQQKKYADLQSKARDMFRSEGIKLDFGNGVFNYVAFERSASMSRNAKLSFIRADYYEPIRKRIMLGMEIGDCQLSKLYAYNGLLLSSGTRIDNVNIDKPHRVIVIDNQKYSVNASRIVTVEDDGTNNPVRKYTRKETRSDVEVTGFDGEGLISKEYATVIDKAYCGEHCHTSFQIRLPYVKGMLHQVDFKDFLTSAGTEAITDIFGVVHKVKDVDIILTKSMFKGYGWLLDNGMTWTDYWKAFSEYNHALYITNVSKEHPEEFTELNYQFLNTLSLTRDEFRPADLPDGWVSSPAYDERNWLTKETETAYYNLCADKEYRLNYFLKYLNRRNRKTKNYRLAAILKSNPLFINEPIYTKELESQSESILKKYALGKLIVAGDNRFLSGDLIEIMTLLLSHSSKKDSRQRRFYSIAVANRFEKNSFYAPQIAYSHDSECTLLRNPHIARNEEIQLAVYPQVEQMRKHYLGHLSDIVIVDTHMLAAERLGGADYDGDMIKTISDPIVNAAVKRNYDLDSLDNMNNIPLLKIPDAEPLIRNADDWEARFEAVKNTFSSRVGQISNAALDRSIIAYDENSDSALRKKCREETETLAILTGLEIDSAKSGVKPDLTEYLGSGNISRSIFLTYKNLVEQSESRREWYQETHRDKLNKFFSQTDWNDVSSNLELLPYFARQLKKHTPKIKARPAKDGELFTFAVNDNWNDNLDKDILSAVSDLLSDYEAVLNRIRFCKVPIKNKSRKSGIERILYSRGQEKRYNSDELYALFQLLSPERISAIRDAIRNEHWHLMGEKEREYFLNGYLPDDDFRDYYQLLCDFRFGGYKVLYDLIADIDDENAALDNRRLIRDSDSTAFAQMMQAYIDKSAAVSYREAVSEKCREILDGIIKPTVAVKYVVALGKRNLLFDLLLDSVEKTVLKKD